MTDAPKMTEARLKDMMRELKENPPAEMSDKEFRDFLKEYPELDKLSGKTMVLTDRVLNFRDDIEERAKALFGDEEAKASVREKTEIRKAYQQEGYLQGEKKEAELGSLPAGEVGMKAFSTKSK
jgi:hypothetical protein